MSPYPPEHMPCTHVIASGDSPEKVGSGAMPLHGWTRWSGLFWGTDRLDAPVGRFHQSEAREWVTAPSAWLTSPPRPNMDAGSPAMPPVAAPKITPIPSTSTANNNRRLLFTPSLLWPCMNLCNCKGRFSREVVRNCEIDY